MFHLKEGIGEIRGIVLKGRRQDLPAVSCKELEQCKMYRNIQEYIGIYRNMQQGLSTAHSLSKLIKEGLVHLQTDRSRHPRPQRAQLTCHQEIPASSFPAPRQHRVT